MVGFGPIFVLYYAQDICGQFELSKNELFSKAKLFKKNWPKIKQKVTKKPRY
jgi:hypothetical protein